MGLVVALDIKLGHVFTKFQCPALPYWLSDDEGNFSVRDFPVKIFLYMYVLLKK